MIYHFLLLGALSTVVDYSVYMLLLSIAVDYKIAIVLGYSLGLMINFILGRTVVFTKGRKVEHLYHELFGILFIGILGAGLNILIVYLLSFIVFELDPSLSRVFSIVIVFFWNYMMRKRFIYD